MATPVTILWVLAALVAQCTSRMLSPHDGRGNTGHPIPMTMVDGEENTEHPMLMTLVDGQESTEQPIPMPLFEGDENTEHPMPMTLVDGQESTEQPIPMPLFEGDENTEHPMPMTSVDGQESTEHPIPMTMNDELDKEHLVIENFEDTNPSKVGDKELFEADILLTDEQWEALRTRKALNYTKYRWTEDSYGFPYVPYVFQDSVDQNDVKAGINHWMENTCIKFGKTTNTSQPHIQFHIGSGCWSYIGMLYFRNGQQISIGRGCNSLGIVVHEIGHAIGFYHEQSRSDRDDYININTANIISGREGNFGKASDNNYNVTYDYSSDMHYSSRGFTTNGGFTIATKDPLAQELIGSRSGLSHRDILLANIMYGCLDKWLAKCSISSNPCQNEGFIGAKCKCICPVHTSGSKCQKVNEEYYANLRSNKTEVISTEGTISVNVTVGDKFTKHIIAPECKTPKLEFKTFKLYSKSSYCYWEILNIRTGDDLYGGDLFCGTEISSGQVFNSSSRQMILYTESRYGRGSYWSAKLTFDDVSGCTSTSLKCNAKGKKDVTYVKKGKTVKFTSPNFPKDYPKKDSCGWILKKSSNGSFVMNCSTFVLQPKKRTCKDYLKVAGKKYCGKTGPNNLKINKDKIYIHFASNGNKQFKGFSCTATVV